jgi:hypothetical protein
MIVKFKWFVDGQQFVRQIRIKTLGDALNIPTLKERGAIEVWEVDGHDYWLVRSKFNMVLAVIYKE